MSAGVVDRPIPAVVIPVPITPFAMPTIRAAFARLPAPGPERAGTPRAVG